MYGNYVPYCVEMSDVQYGTGFADSGNSNSLDTIVDSEEVDVAGEESR